MPIEARADGHVFSCVADGVSAALSTTWVLALVFKAGLVIGTFNVIDALPSYAPSDGIADVSRVASANRTLLVVPVVAGLTLRVGTARIRLAQIFLGEGSAHGEGIASHFFRARADRGDAVAQFAVGVDAANAVARVFARVVEASRFRLGTVAVLGALRLAGRQWIS